ncbi:hypothetical protein DFH06DRAFT_1358367 [Mycena polygramma]|nr:hypothetical protein DFH06DRAFT_1358367 [Mycena polygramma]
MPPSPRPFPHVRTQSTICIQRDVQSVEASLIFQISRSHSRTVRPISRASCTKRGSCKPLGVWAVLRLRKASCIKRKSCKPLGDRVAPRLKSSLRFEKILLQAQCKPLGARVVLRLTRSFREHPASSADRHVRLRLSCFKRSVGDRVILRSKRLSLSFESILLQTRCKPPGVRVVSRFKTSFRFKSILIVLFRCESILPQKQCESQDVRVVLRMKTLFRFKSILFQPQCKPLGVRVVLRLKSARVSFREHPASTADRGGALFASSSCSLAVGPGLKTRTSRCDTQRPNVAKEPVPRLNCVGVHWVLNPDQIASPFSTTLYWPCTTPSITPVLHSESFRLLRNLNLEPVGGRRSVSANANEILPKEDAGPTKDPQTRLGAFQRVPGSLQR